MVGVFVGVLVGVGTVAVTVGDGVASSRQTKLAEAVPSSQVSKKYQSTADPVVLSSVRETDLRIEVSHRYSALQVFQNPIETIFSVLVIPTEIVVWAATLTLYQTLFADTNVPQLGTLDDTPVNDTPSVLQLVTQALAHTVPSWVA